MCYIIANMIGELVTRDNPRASNTKNLVKGKDIISRDYLGQGHITNAGTHKNGHKQS